MLYCNSRESSVAQHQHVFLPRLSSNFPHSWIQFFPFPTFGVLITGSDLWGALNWNDRGVAVLKFSCSRGVIARQVSPIKSLGKRQPIFFFFLYPCCYHVYHHNSKCPSSFSRVISSMYKCVNKCHLWGQHDLPPVLLQTPAKAMLAASPAFKSDILKDQTGGQTHFIR